MRFYSKQTATNDVLLLATIADRLSFIAWSKTKDAEKGKNRPQSILEALIGKEKDVTTYDTADEYELARRKLLERIEHG